MSFKLSRCNFQDSCVAGIYNLELPLRAHTKNTASLGNVCVLFGDERSMFVNICIIDSWFYWWMILRSSKTWIWSVGPSEFNSRAARPPSSTTLWGRKYRSFLLQWTLRISRMENRIVKCFHLTGLVLILRENEHATVLCKEKKRAAHENLSACSVANVKRQ